MRADAVILDAAAVADDPAASSLVAALRARGVEVTLAGANTAVAAALGLPPAAAGLDAAATAARLRSPYGTLVAVTKGEAPAEASYTIRVAAPSSGDWPAGADCSTLAAALPKRRVAVIGSGAWACAATSLLARNLRTPACADFEPAVPVWVHDETLADGRSIVDAINEDGVNEKYLPGVPLGPNVTAVRDLAAAVADADLLVICAPHQFVGGIAASLAGALKPGGVAALSLVKGMRVTPAGPQLVSELIARVPGVASVAVLSGPNIAAEVAAGGLAEASLGYEGDVRAAAVWRRLFQTPSFHVDLVPGGDKEGEVASGARACARVDLPLPPSPSIDRAGVECAGTLKNVVALGVGLAAGAGAADNARATLLRAGLAEMAALATRLYPSARRDTLLEAAGVADLVATCAGGRNALVGAEFAARHAAGRPTTFEALEAELLRGQKLQGALTAAEVDAVLEARGWRADFPLMTVVAAVVAGVAQPGDVLRFREAGKALAQDGACV
jgi:glycerol-3-phosphate dehydrogenase (NAD+)